jgi:hypothetical protein
MFAAHYSCPLTTDSDPASCSVDVERAGCHGYTHIWRLQCSDRTQDDRIGLRSDYVTFE